jgi:hypothetical protein
MDAFLGTFGHLVLGVLSGFDRLVFRGHLRQLSYTQGMGCYLWANQVLLKDFKAHAIEQTKALIDASLADAQRLKRPILYLNSSAISKENEARRLATRDDVQDGLICVLKCVEPCMTYEVHRNRERKMLELRSKQGKCSFLYHYYVHPQFGLMHARVQTWFPYAIQICINGREWLARQMDKAGLSYERRDNKFIDVESFAKAQALLDQQLRTAWPKTLDAIARTIHPAHPRLLGQAPVDYYWSAFQSEWASDIVFRERADAERLFGQWVRHAMMNYRSADVMRFLGKALPSHGQVHAKFEGEVVSTLRRREEGVCVKHWVNGNSIKMYDCDRNVRIETTINQPEQFKVYRPSEADPEGKKEWLPMRRGVADLSRRAEVSQAANERYAASTAAIQDTRPLKEVVEPYCQRVAAPGKTIKRKVRALNPFAAEDAALLEAVNDPKHTANGFRNRDLVDMLYEKRARTNEERKRRSARVTRLIRLLRAHGILHKVPKTHRYHVSPNGREAVTAMLAARNANTEFLMTNAA